MNENEEKSDLVELNNDPIKLLTRIAEKDGIDYKTKFSSEADDLYNTVKIFAAMANSGGGIVIYGVNKTVLVGVDDTQIKLLDPANLKGKLSSFLSPMPSLSSEVIEYQDKKYVLVVVESIGFSPVLIAKTVNDKDNKLVFRAGTIFVRENTQSVEVTSEFKMRQILELSVNYEIRRRLKELMPLFNLSTPANLNKLISEGPSIVEVKGIKQAKELSGIEDNIASREVIFLLKNGEKLFENTIIRNIFKLNSKIGGLVLPHYGYANSNFKAGSSENGYMSYFKNNDESRANFCRIECDGSFYARNTLLEDDYAKEEKYSRLYANSVGVEFTENYIAMSVLLGHEYLKRLDVNELDLQYSLKGVRGRRLIVQSFEKGSFNYDRISLDDNVSYKTIVTKNMTQDDLIDTASRIATDLFGKFNWFPDDKSIIPNDMKKAFSSAFIEQREIF